MAMPPQQTTIVVNNRARHTTADQLTGAEIKQLAEVPANYELFLVHEPGGGAPGDEQIPDGRAVALRNGMKFRAVPPGNQG